MKSSAMVLFVLCFFSDFSISCLNTSSLLSADSQETIHLQKIFVFADSFEKVFLDTSSYYNVYKDNSLIGYGFLGDNSGLVGPVITLTGISADGICIGVLLLSHNETPQYFVLLEKKSFFDKFTGMKIGFLDIENRNFNDYEIDAVTGATISSFAVIENFWEAAFFYNKIIEMER
ncbi:FMN-binding protein [candidate division WOR-3 bacterium]|nr:FMN-binding protein [candidate division WOR-3 bacterium]